MRRDVASAYAVTGARVIGWVLVSGIVFRKLGADALGLLTLVRATVGILAYSSLGIGPAMVKIIADFERREESNVPLAALAVEDEEAAKRVIAYAQGGYERKQPELGYAAAQAYRTGEKLATYLGLLGLALTILYAIFFHEIHGVTRYQAEHAQILVVCFGIGTVCRLISDPASGFLQARELIALDNCLLASAELAWGALSLWTLLNFRPELDGVGYVFVMVNFLLLIARLLASHLRVQALTKLKVKSDWQIARKLISLGSLIVLAQAADFLYAPTDCILINQLLGADFVAYYSPAIQIDAGLLLLVGGLAAVLYPKSAAAHAEGNLARLRTYYLRGTVFSGLILLVAGAIVWALSKWIFQIWFHDPMDQTRMILPLILVHTVIGGSSSVGRSVLIAMGKARAFTIAVLIAGTSNVILSFIFVKYAHLGLVGIVLGTIVVVVARCAVWMPWYVIRTLNNVGATPASP